MLTVTGLVGGYGQMRVLEGVDLTVPSGRCVAVLGPNGAGKTTLLRNICGLETPWDGQVRFQERAITGQRPHLLVRMGIVLVPEGRHLFGTMSVRDNLAIAGDHASGIGRSWSLAEIYELFPILRSRGSVEARRMSGGEQQMLAIARALMLAPAVIALDEPSTGLAPQVVRSVMEIIGRLAETGVAVLLVEQNAREVVRIADEVNVLGHGRLSWRGTPAELDQDQELRASYLGTG